MLKGLSQSACRSQVWPRVWSKLRCLLTTAILWVCGMKFYCWTNWSIGQSQFLDLLAYAQSRCVQVCACIAALQLVKLGGQRLSRGLKGDTHADSSGARLTSGFKSCDSQHTGRRCAPEQEQWQFEFCVMHVLCQNGTESMLKAS